MFQIFGVNKQKLCLKQKETFNLKLINIIITLPNELAFGNNQNK